MTLEQESLQLPTERVEKKYGNPSGIRKRARSEIQSEPSVDSQGFWSPEMEEKLLFLESLLDAGPGSI